MASLAALAGGAEAGPAPWPELKLTAEYPVEGMPGGNLSGLAWCGDALWSVSDREDDRLYRLLPEAGQLRAEAETFDAPPPPDNGMAWGQRMRTWASGLARGGDLDFEGITCDSAGNRYLVSEARAAVLQVSPAGLASWLNLPDNLLRQARAGGMLVNFNAMFEGIAIDPPGERLWLAAERERRGLLVLHRQGSAWSCTGGCVLLSEGGNEASPPAAGGKSLSRDFSDVAWHAGKLFTLERQGYRICRRKTASAEVERCWSIAAEALTEPRRYPVDYGMAEALWLDEEGAWIGVDNGFHRRADGETRPIVWRFAAPTGGWNAP
ncbi:esterase-like activity of phytase family protein [Pseudomonas sp. RIT-PI-AD]|uniref:esterase-like activity of phytase family protein n=1 Tax=Pseudomonas sp. RIT-PI-AD TaxID=3035294 RepID=UPI0021D7EC97|nr:esterase-like activity of phytase family protein [Pseudomonas sp. RIT-PI-AD]